MRTRYSAILLLACLASASPIAGQNSPSPKKTNETPASDASAAFERMKRLAGKWESRSTVGWQGSENIRVIARGSALIFSSEFKDVPGEGMVTLYFVDQGRLKLTHYCEARNQPTLEATSITADGITFEFKSGTGMASRDTGHMDKVVTRFLDNDHFTEQWSWYQNGQQRLFEEVEYRRARTEQSKDPSTMSKADEAFEAKDWAKAAELYAAITKAEPGNARAWFQLGAAYHELAQYARASEAFDQARKAGGFGSPGLLVFRRVRAYAMAGKKDQALELLREAVDGDFPGVTALDTHPDLASLRSDPRFAEIRAIADRNTRPCENNPDYRRFDFWLGEWNVLPTGTTGAQTGSSSIQLILNGCIIFENWTGGNNYTGKSFNLFNRATKKWEQVWVDNAGGIVKFEGQFDKDGVLHYYAENPGPNSTRIRRHLQFIPQGPDQVRQFSQQSTDDGKTWSPEYDLTYKRKK